MIVAVGLETTSTSDPATCRTVVPSASVSLLPLSPNAAAAKAHKTVFESRVMTNFKI